MLFIKSFGLLDLPFILPFNGSSCSTNNSYPMCRKFCHPEMEFGCKDSKKFRENTL